jgi:hypothetical protein
MITLESIQKLIRHRRVAVVSLPAMYRSHGLYGAAWPTRCAAMRCTPIPLYLYPELVDGARCSAAAL